MSRTKVTWLFIAGSVIVVAGVVLGLVTALPAILSGGVFTIGGPQVITVNGAGFAGTAVWLAIASVVVFVGWLAALVSWIAALFNTAQLEDRTWFLVLLILGLCSLGWLAMIAYVIAGPDSTQRHQPSAAAAAPAL